MTAHRGVLAVIPHPDDETYGFGGLLALASAAGWPVTVAAATAGEGGERHDGMAAEPETLGPARRAELLASCAELGVSNVECWGLPDGGLHGDDSLAVGRIVALVGRLRPALLLSLGADGAYGHPDHIAVHQWIETARSQLAGEVHVLYAAFAPGLFAEQHEKCVAAGVMGDPPSPRADDLGLTLADYEIGIPSVRERKLAAIAAHRTQLPGGDPFKLFPGDTVEQLLRVERFVDARGAAPSADAARLLSELTPSATAPAG